MQPCALNRDSWDPEGKRGYLEGSKASPSHPSLGLKVKIKDACRIKLLVRNYDSPTSSQVKTLRSLIYLRQKDIFRTNVKPKPTCTRMTENQMDHLSNMVEAGCWHEVLGVLLGPKCTLMSRAATNPNQTRRQKPGRETQGAVKKTKNVNMSKSKHTMRDLQTRTWKGANY